MIARCACGKCSLETTGRPTLNAICNCSNCKRRTGSAFGWSVYVKSDSIVEIKGELSDFRVTATGEQVRRFCKACGTTLYWTGDFRPGETGVAGGCFAPGTNDLGEPMMSAQDSTRCAWFQIPDAWPRIG